MVNYDLCIEDHISRNGSRACVFRRQGVISTVTRDRNVFRIGTMVDRRLISAIAFAISPYGSINGRQVPTRKFAVDRRLPGCFFIFLFKRVSRSLRGFFLSYDFCKASFQGIGLGRANGLSSDLVLVYRRPNVIICGGGQRFQVIVLMLGRSFGIFLQRAALMGIFVVYYRTVYSIRHSVAIRVRIACNVRRRYL